MTFAEKSSVFIWDINVEPFGDDYSFFEFGDENLVDCRYHWLIIRTILLYEDDLGVVSPHMHLT